MPYKFNPLLGAGLDDVGSGGAAATPGGSDTQVQFNNSGSFGGSAALTWDDTGKVLGVGGDIDLDDGGTYATTLQVITPTANRTISYPDATGTLALVAGSSGQLIYNNAGANAGVQGSIIGATGDVTLSLAGAASTPPLKLTGTWFSGGTSTTTTPQLLIDGSATPSTAWSTSGTGLGINAASGFTGNLLDLQVNGTSQLRVSNAGGLAFPSVGVADLGFSPQAGNALNFNSNGARIRFNQFSLNLGICELHLGGNLSKGNVLLSAAGLGILEQKDATNAQTYRLYNTYTSATSFECAKLSWNTNVLEVGTEKGGDGGTARDMVLQTDGTTRITLKADGAILFSGLPTSDPAVAGQLWNDGNTLKISAG